MIAVGSKPEGDSRAVPHVPSSCRRRPLLGAEEESRGGPEPSFVTPTGHSCGLRNAGRAVQDSVLHAHCQRRLRFHSITRSARLSSSAGMVTPRRLPVFLFINTEER